MLSPTGQRNETAWLNGIRGVASLIVAFTHFIAGEIEVGFRGFFADPPDENRRFFQLPPFRIIFADQAMVAIFFVVSAYSISIGPLKLRDYAPREKFLSSLASSVFRRPIRLYVPVVALEILSHLAFYLGFYPYTAFWDEHLQSLWDVMVHFFGYMLDAIYPFTPRLPIGLNIQIWTIPAEFRGSCVVYLIILCTSSMRPIMRLAIIQLASLLSLWHLDWITFTFMCGLTICEIRSFQEARQVEILPVYKPASDTIWIRIGKWVLFICGFYLLCIPEKPADDPWSLEYKFLGNFEASEWERYSKISQMWRSLGAAMCIFSISNTPALQAPFNTALAQYLGKISFGLYLVHIMIYRIWRDQLIRYIWWITGSDNQFGWVGAGIILGLVVWWAAHTFYRVVDTRSITIAKWLDTKLKEQEGCCEPLLR